ncbi:transposase [Agarivorans sp. Alg241-V36]|uniref:transposase n=1 Tax=Agarivorans sp. Alg241-V36 TaxID=2305992 RepID=UPI001F0762AC|nr:transposase [Agarivorans sp. Alg241-V36]
MTRAREQQICLDSTPYYHCICRCVRRAYLCGEDRVTGTSFEHRKQWIVDKFTQLTQVFSVEVCAYAVMSNHYHLVLRVNQEQAEQWSGVIVK